MYGFINTCLKSLVIEKYGEETWDLLRVNTGVQDTFMTYEVYKDEITLQLVEKACQMLGVSPEAVLQQFGEYFFEFCKRSGYDHMLRTLGGNLYEFIANLDALHSYLSLSYQAMNAPSFRVEMNDDGSMHLHYYSDRRGLCHIVPGIMGAVALDFFKTEISMEIISQSDEEERTGKKEHIVFLVTQRPIVPPKSSNRQTSQQNNKQLGIGCRLRQQRLSYFHHCYNCEFSNSRRSGDSRCIEQLCCEHYVLDHNKFYENHNEDNCTWVLCYAACISGPYYTSIIQTHFHSVMEQLTYIKITSQSIENAVNKLRDRANQVSVCPVKKKNHWGTIRGIVQFGRGKMLRGFLPVYPKTLWVDVKTFCNGLPFHIVFDEELRVKQAGVSIQRIVPGLQTMGIRLDQYFSTVHPEVTLTISNVRKFINSQFVFRTKREMMPESWRERPMLELRGQMIWMESLECMLYLCSPLLRNLNELEERQMHISDIAPHDVTRDLILLNQQRLAEMELSNQLERKKEELRILSKHLEEEKKKTEALLYAMLPKHVANQLKEGKRVEAGEFKECTILFSDVVTFTNICAQCEPIQIVAMLNSMYLRFDRLTTVHDVYKVETIGDAYMVVGGVPVPVSTHAERVANFALGMILMAKEVKNPVTGNPIQIRVGLHTGPVLAGVVGEKMPRYCLFGDTVNTASRMESHGVPNKIHLSPEAYRCLKDKEFEITARGEIDVKGKGKMCTYFLVRNISAQENEILGKPAKETDSGRESSQSVHEDPSKGSLQMTCPQATQEEFIQNSCPSIPMHYDDSLPFSDRGGHNDVTGKISDPNGYRKVQNGRRVEDDCMKKSGEKHEPENVHVRSHFCVII